jgi:hypothetical protein
MDVTTMLSITLLVSQLKIDYPQFLFKESVRFLWSPTENTIYYTDKGDNSCIFLLHELSHGLLNHADYNYDIELIAMEREAWDKFMDLAKFYSVTIDDNIIQSTLDTYRDWLHSRSNCPNCKATGVQIGKNNYTCLACSHGWKVNEARICALRRYNIRNTIKNAR